MEYPKGLKRSADISSCGQYRYSLGRGWDTRLPSCVFVGLNPSTADAERDDPTIRRCISFTQKFGFGGFIMLNLFAFRATYPRQLVAAEKPLGKRNRETFISYSMSVNVFICAWGPPKPRFESTLNFTRHAREMLELIEMPKVYCLGLTKGGYPRHPLMVPGNKELEEYDWRNHESD